MSKTTAGQQTGVASSGTPLEEMLGNIWGDVLGVREVGREDNFFELGGHSLLATRVISRIREVFKVELPLREIFEKPRLRELAGGIETIRSRGGSRVEAPVEGGGRGGGLSLFFCRGRLWVFH